jgi:hypothetical protein
MMKNANKNGTEKHIMFKINKLTFAAILSLSLSGPAIAAPTEVKATNAWKGSVGDVKLRNEKPDNGVIADAKGFEKLVKAWNVEKVPALDFTNELVLVDTTVGSSLNLTAILDESGNLKVTSIATRDFGPGFRYVIISVSKEGVKTVNGKPLPK